MLDHLPHPRGQVSDVDAGTHFDEPDGQPTTQAGRDVFNDDD
jgi:hypothetical protein